MGGGCRVRRSRTRPGRGCGRARGNGDVGSCRTTARTRGTLPRRSARSTSDGARAIDVLVPRVGLPAGSRWSAWEMGNALIRGLIRRAMFTPPATRPSGCRAERS
eukprot:5649808-Prymnesium_polylepis.1